MMNNYNYMTKIKILILINVHYYNNIVNNNKLNKILYRKNDNY